MATGWSHEATRALLSIWKEQDIQSQLDGVQRNRVIYEGTLILGLLCQYWIYIQVLPSHCKTWAITIVGHSVAQKSKT